MGGRGLLTSRTCPAVVSAWVSLQPSERLWLAGRVLANPGVQKIRRGIALILSGGPAGEGPAPRTGSARRDYAEDHWRASSL